MTKLNQIYKCSVCGNIVAVVHEGSGELVCCGQSMVLQTENSVDASTGMVMIRATMANADELLWPGTLVTTKLNIRDDEAVTVPSAAIQVSQAGTFVFVIKDGKAEIQKVEVERTAGTTTVLKSGLQGGESVVTDGHLQLRNGSRVNIRAPKTGT